MKKADPFQKVALNKFQKQLQNWAAEHGISLQSPTASMKDRTKKVVAKTFYQCGIVVPFDKKTKVGYREIPESEGKEHKFCCNFFLQM